MKFFSVFLFCVCFTFVAEAQTTTKLTTKPMATTSKTTTSTRKQTTSTTQKPTTSTTKKTITKQTSTSTTKTASTAKPTSTTKQVSIITSSIKPTTSTKPTVTTLTTKQASTITSSSIKSTTLTTPKITASTAKQASTVTTSNKPTTPVITTATSTTRQTTATVITTTVKPTTSSQRTTSSPTVVTTQTSLTENPYCNISTCSVPCENTLCKFTNATWGAACQPPYPNQSIVSLSDISLILNTHNSYRSKVAKGLETRGNPGPQPVASNMRKVFWDDELAAMSTAHALQCVYEHDICRDVGRFRVGQNMYIVESSVDNLGTSNWTEAMAYWYDEVQYMTSGYISSLPLNPTNSIGHYTQLVWAETYSLGCGVAYYQSNFTAGYPYNRLYVCNYGPAGNWIGSSVYSQGTTGSGCPSGTIGNTDGLCA